jgi:alkanesulfonate monooxygenase SsuD/methylene tetrahydromethanopterin reductase-like flavin-dependent oxidoreductase (luciferase family)
VGNAGRRDVRLDRAHSPVTDSPALAKPSQEKLPIIIGGGGPRRTPALAARFATEFNTPLRFGRLLPHAG